MATGQRALPWIIVLVVFLGLVVQNFDSSLVVRTAFGQAAYGATLTILAAPVETAAAGSSTFAPARDGITLGPGDQIRTGPAGVAVVTFFDGSETQLAPESQVQLQQTDPASPGGPRIRVFQAIGTTVDRVQVRLNQPTNFSTDTPAGTAVVRGTRYAITVKCYAAPPALPPTPLLTFPRRLSETSYLLADEVVYDDGGTLWLTRAWQDPTTGDRFDTYDQIGATYAEVADAVYADNDGSYWIDRKWQDPETSDTWDTYEDVGVPVDALQAAGLPRVVAAPRMTAQFPPQPGCHPLTSVAVIEGRVGLLPSTAALTPFDITAGQAGATSDVATASSPLTQLGFQSFDQATSNPRDPSGARTAGQLGSQVADEFANVIVPRTSGPGGSGGPGGPGGPGGQQPPGAAGMGLISPSGLLGGVAVQSATADSGLVAFIVPPPVSVAGAQSTPQVPDTPVPPPQPASAQQPPILGATGAGASAPVVLPPSQSAPPASSHGQTGGNGSPPSPTPLSADPNVAQAVIGSVGGSFGLPDGSARVTIPPGAVPDNTTIRIVRNGSPPSAPAGQQLASTAVDLTATGATGPVALAAPATITLAFSGGQSVGVFFFNSITSSWQAVDGGSTTNSAAGTVTGTTSHLTLFGALTVPAASPTPTSIGTTTDTPTPASTTPTTPATATQTPTFTPTPSAAATSTLTPTPTLTSTPSPTPTPTTSPPGSDNFANAPLIVGPATLQGTTLGATLEPGEPQSTCQPISRSVWYRITAPHSGALYLHLQQSSFFGMLTLYSGTTLQSLTQVACGNYFTSNGDVLVPITAGQIYYLQVGTIISDFPNNGGQPGAFTIQVSLDTSTLPDLVPILSMSTLWVVERPLDVPAEIQNRGGGGASASSMGVYIDPRTQPQPGDPPVLAVDVPSLAPGATTAVQGTLASGSLAVGNHTVTVLADRNGAVVESNKANNTASLPVQIGHEPSNDWRGHAQQMPVPGSVTANNDFALDGFYIDRPPCGLFTQRLIYQVSASATGTLTATVSQSTFDNMLSVASMGPFSPSRCSVSRTGQEPVPVSIQVNRGDVISIVVGSFIDPNTGSWSTGTFTLDVR